MRYMKRALAIAAIALFIALPLAAQSSTRHAWRVVPVSNLCGETGNIHATGLTDVPYIKLVRVSTTCGDDWCVTFPAGAQSDFGAEGFDSPGAALGAYHHAKLVRKLNAWLFTVDQDGTTILVTRRK